MKSWLAILTIIIVSGNFFCKKEPARSSDWFAAIPDSLEKRKVIMGCTSCHQLGIATSMQPSESEWRKTVKKMLAIDEKLKLELIPLTEDALVSWLTANTGIPDKGASYETRPATFTEMPAGDFKGFYHDIAVSGGKAFMADYFGNVLYAIDTKTQKVTEYKLPVAVEPGKPAGAHAIDTTKDGTVYITFTKSEQVIRFHPSDMKFKVYSGFPAGGNVQYFVLDKDRNIYEDRKGGIWVSHFSREILSRLDLRTGAIKSYMTQRTEGMRESAVHLYAAVADSNGLLWYTETHGNKMGYLDPATGKTEEYDMPIAWSGPKRLAIDEQDRLFIPELATGRITIYDTRKRQIERTLALPIKGDYPYGIRRNPYTGDMWITGSGSDTLYRLDPKNDRFTIYRLPRRGTFTRTIAFEEDGSIWTSYSTFPLKQIEMPHKNGVALRMTVP